MRVNQSNNPSIQNAQTEASKKSDQAQKTQKPRSATDIYNKNAAGAAVSAKAEISAKGKEFAAAHTAAAGAPDVREDRVAELKRRIAEGKYEVDANRIADKMVGDHMQF